MLPSLATAIREERATGVKVIVVLAGDFISPALLSSLDKGFGMIDVLNQIGVDYVCFGNHEDDVDFATLKNRIKQSSFIWINSNIEGLELPDTIKEKVPSFATVTVSGENTGRQKTVSLLGLCTDDPHLYKPGRFGGAQIKPVNSTARQAASLQKSMNLIIPITHQDIQLDRDLAATQLFPVIIGGHEHETFLENINGSLIVKTGVDAGRFSVIDVEWYRGMKTPKVSAVLKETRDYPPEKNVLDLVGKHLRAVELLQDSVLCKIPESVVLSSLQVRQKPCTMAVFLCSIIRKAVQAECCIVNAGTFRGDRSYDGSVFTYRDLVGEMPFNSEIGQYQLPGRVINDVLSFSRAAALENPPVEKGGYMQSCDAIVWDPIENQVVSINGEPLEMNRLYNTAVSYQTVAGLDNIEPLLTYLGVDPDTSNSTGNQEYDFIGAKELIVSYFCLAIWQDMLLSVSFETMDQDKGGNLSKEEVYAAFERHYEGDFKLSRVVVDNLFAMVDLNEDGEISLTEFQRLKDCMEDIDFKSCEGGGVPILAVDGVPMEETDDSLADSSMLHMSRSVSLLGGHSS
ncbi:Metallo-dependent phosphatase-like protein [Obelidium mucronatum]|nr:Metallo-dependent phosphatase-like protein [Obelidium mucronatum]